MLIPIGTDRPRKRPTVITYWLMAVNVAVFLVQMFWERFDPEGAARLIQTFMLFPDEAQFRIWQLLSYQFLHAGWMHLLGNLLFLYVFGPAVEDRLTRLGFLAFYLVGGTIAGLVHMLFEINPVIGASGAISAVTGAFLVLFPLTHIRVLLFFILIGIFSFPAWWFIAFAIARDLLYQGIGGTNVAYLAHLGGYAFGASVPLTLLTFHVIPREPYDLFSIGRQAHRRRVFRELTTRGGTPWTGELEPKARTRREHKPDSAQEKLAERRTAVTAAVNAGDLALAAQLYRSLLDDFVDPVLHRNAQLEVANQLATTADHATAATAYDLFLRRYPNDAEAMRVRLLLAVINARYLNDPIRAKQLLAEVREAGPGDEHRALIAALDEDLG